VQARAALRGGQPATAASLARRALERDASDGDARLLLGLSLEALGRAEEAVIVLAAGTRPPSEGAGNGGDSQAAAVALRRLLPMALPARLAPDLQAGLPGARPTGTVGSSSFTVVVPEGTLSSPDADPKYGWKYTRRAAVYIASSRRYTLHYQNGEDAAIAARVADLLGRLHCAAVGFAPRSTAPPEVHVWLPRAGRAGGEQFRDSIYLFAVQVPRSDGEWVREVAHELGHLLLPSLARYDDPEPMENGYLGERLLPKWLFDRGIRSVWDGRVRLAEYLRQRAAPLRTAFLKAGPGSPLRTDRGPAGMDYAIGLILTLEAQHGPELLARVIARNEATGLESLLLAYREEIATLRSYRIPVELVVPDRSVVRSIAAGRLPFRRAIYRAYLPSGSWTLTVRGVHLTGLRATREGQDLRRIRSSGREARFTLAMGVSRWHLLELETTSPGAALSEIELTVGSPPGEVASGSPRVEGRNEPRPGRN
jgi:hypothetical protein